MYNFITTSTSSAKNKYRRPRLQGLKYKLARCLGDTYTPLAKYLIGGVKPDPNN